MAIRILLLNYEFPPLGGGASPVSGEIATRLTEAGQVQIDVVTMGFDDLPRIELPNGRLTIYRVPCVRRKRERSNPFEQMTYLLSADRLCRRLLRKNIYDVCHCHFLIPTGILAERIHRRTGLPYVVTSHGSDVPGHNPDRFRLLHRFTGPMIRRVIQSAAAITTPSQYLGNRIAAFIGSTRPPIVTIPNGIDTSAFRPLKKEKIILASGRLLSFKGFHILLQAVRNHDIGYEVHIAGDGPMAGVLRRIAAHSKTRVLFHGWLDNRGEEYRSLLGRASIVALPSERENASITLLEALSAGCAVITTHVGGNAEIVGDVGFLIQPNDPVALRNVLRDQIHNPEQLQDIQRRSRARAIDLFAWPAIISQYEALLAQSARTQHATLGQKQSHNSLTVGML